MLKLYIPAMTCSHCAQEVESTVRAADAGAMLEFDLPNRMVSVKSAAKESGLLGALLSAGFPAHKVT